MKSRNRRRGTQLLEFTLTGIPTIFLCISVVESSLCMWEYHTLARVCQQTARYAQPHGYNCTVNGNSCTLTLGAVATFAEGRALGLVPSKLNMTFYSATNTYPCNPITTCTSNTGNFPPATDNAVGDNITVTASYTVTNPLAIFWPGGKSVITRPFTLGATSTQVIEF